MKKASKKEIIKQKTEEGLIPSDLIEEINNDIDKFLADKVKKNRNTIEYLISERKSSGLPIFFSEEKIENYLTTIFYPKGF